MRKKLLSIILAALMVVSLMPTVAFAATHDLKVWKDAACTQVATEGTEASHEDSDYYWTNECKLHILKGGLTVSGTSITECIDVDASVTDLTINNLTIEIGVNNPIQFLGTGNATLTLVGNSSLILNNYGDAIRFGQCNGIIAGTGSVTASSLGNAAISGATLTFNQTGTVTAEGFQGILISGNITFSNGIGKILARGWDPANGAVSGAVALGDALTMKGSIAYDTDEANITGETTIEGNNVKTGGQVALSVLIGGTAVFEKAEPKLVPDFNKDGKIDNDDVEQLSSGAGFTILPNDDDDEGGNDGIVGEDEDCKDGQVDGANDLLDFFPVLVDVSGITNCDDLTWKIKTSGDAYVNVVYTKLNAENVSDFANAKALDGETPLSEAAITKLCDDDEREHIERQLPDDFLKNGKGILLIEGRKRGVGNIVLTGYNKTGVDIASFTLPIKVAKPGDVSTFTELKDAIAGAKAGEETTITLINNLASMGSVVFYSDKQIVLDMNGHTLNCSGTAVRIKGDLTITGNGTIENTRVQVEETGQLTLESGKIKGLNSTDKFGMVCLLSSGAIFIMNGGEISGNTAVNGAGVYVAAGEFTMNGGEIIDNRANHGAGVYVESGKFTMNDGKIGRENYGNTANNDGGGVYVAGKGTFEINGGAIAYNRAEESGGGIYAAAGAEFTMDQTAGKTSEVCNNTAKRGGGILTAGVSEIKNGKINYNSAVSGDKNAGNGGGVYIANETGSKFTFSGGEISHNTAANGGAGIAARNNFCMTGGIISDNTTETGFGGGVYAYGSDDTASFNIEGTSKCAFEMTDGTISGNTAAKGGGVYLDKYNMVMIMTGGSISGNKATSYGGGVAVGQKSISVGGTANITGNKLGKIEDQAFVPTEDSNLLLHRSAGAVTDIPQIVIAEPMTAGAMIGVSTDNPIPTSTSPVAITAENNVCDTSYLVSDNSAYEVAQDGTHLVLQVKKAPVYSGGGSSTPTVTVPISGDGNSVKVEASVSGSTATVKEIKDADLAKVTEGESVAIDLSAAGKNVDTAKLPTQTVEKIAEKSSLTVKLPAATVEFDKAATEEIADQAKGSNIELVVDDVKEVSLNAVQKEAVGKLDTAIIIDAYLESNGSKLCTSDNGGFGGGSAKVILPYEIKNNRKPENYSVFYVNEAGKLEKLNAAYDEELKAFVFEIEHFSVYAVAFEQFVDIDTNAYYYDAVKWAAENGVTDGIDDTHFNPNGITNRAQMVTFLWKAAGRPEPTITETPFTDLDPNGYYCKAVLWAYEKGITDGTTETTFEPDMNVSRAQVVTFLWRYSGKLYVDYWMQMTDVASGQYYTEAVRWALAEGITEGTSKTTFSPNDDCLRGQIVTFLYRSLVK